MSRWLPWTTPILARPSPAAPDHVGIYAPRLQPGVSRNEFLWLAGAILAGALLRLSFPQRIAIEHFDEGVYASNFWFGAEAGYEYPARHLYAPPLLPLVIEWTMILASLCGIRTLASIPMIPCLAAGIATIPSIWWIGRRWFGRSAGLVAAWLVATSDFHASYSRAALTDVPLGLFMLWGLYFVGRALQTGERRNIVLAGLFTGLAWWTKYNGWLPLAIGLAGGTACRLFPRAGSFMTAADGPASQGRALPRSRGIAELAARWAMVAGLTLLFWSPVWIGLQKHGGYQVVAANHRQYLVGTSGWANSAVSQLSHFATYDALPWPFESGDESESPAGPSGRTASGNLVSALFVLASLAACLVSIARRWQLTTAGSDWLLLAWMVGLSVATPFYYPYPRLILPWLLAVWLGFGLAVQRLVSGSHLSEISPSSDVRYRRAAWLEAAVVLWLALGVSLRCWNGSMIAWQDRTGIQKAAGIIGTEIRSRTAADGFAGDEAIVYVYGEPAVVFALKAGGLSLVSPVQSLDFLDHPSPRPTFLVGTRQALQKGAFSGTWETHQAKFDTVAIREVERSLLVRLDRGSAPGTPGISDELWAGRAR